MSRHTSSPFSVVKVRSFLQLFTVAAVAAAVVTAAYQTREYGRDYVQGGKEERKRA